MPTFTLPVVALYSKDSYTLFASTDTLAAGNNSQIIAIGTAGPVPRGVMTFQGDFASAPTAQWIIYGSNTQPTSAGPQNGVALYTSSNKQHDNYTDNLAFIFYWAQLVSQSAGGALTLTVHVG